MNIQGLLERLNERSTSIQADIAYLLGAAERFTTSGDNRSASQIYECILGFDESRYDVRTKYAVFLANTSRTDEAIVELEIAKCFAPVDAQAPIDHELVQIYCNAGQYDRLLPLADRIIDSPWLTEYGFGASGQVRNHTTFLRGIAHMKMGDYYKAFGDFTSLIPNFRLPADLPGGIVQENAAAYALACIKAGPDINFDTISGNDELIRVFEQRFPAVSMYSGFLTQLPPPPTVHEFF